MKFCQRRRLVYCGLNNIVTSTDYITLEDIEEFHGKDFASKWLEFIKQKPTLSLNDKKGYYYSDYQFAARQADSILNAKNY